MQRLRDTMGQWFSRISGVLYGRPVLGLGGALILILGLSLGVARLELDTSYSGFLEEEDPVLIQYQAFREQFGQNTALFVALEPARVFDLDFLKKLETIHQELKDRVPDLDEITSLVNAWTTRIEGDLLVVEGLRGSWPKSREELPAFREKTLGTPLYRNQIISADGALAVIVLKINTADQAFSRTADSRPGGSDPSRITETMTQGFGEDSGEDRTRPALLKDRGNRPAFKAIQAILEKHAGPDLKIHLAGAMAVSETLKSHLRKDLFFLIMAALAVIGVCLLLTWLRLTGVLGPLMVVGSALASTLGIMGYLGVDLKLPTLILPTIVLTAGVGDSIHVLALFFQRYGVDEKEAALLAAFRRSGPALLITTLTTAAGLVSFAASRVTPIAELALFAAIGVCLALVFTLLLLPGLIALIPLKPAGPDRYLSHPALRRVIPWIAGFTTARPWVVLAAGAIILIAALAGMRSLSFSHDILGWMPPESRLRQDHLVADRRLGGTIFIEAVIDAGEPDGLHDPDLLKGLDSFAQGLSSSPGLPVGRAFSLTDVIREIHQALNQGRPQDPPLPGSRRLISQELLLFEAAGGEYLEPLVDNRFQLGRLSLTVPTTDALEYPPFLEKLKRDLGRRLPPGTSVVWTGTAALIGQTVLETLRSIPLGYTTALIMITTFMVLLLGRLRLGLLSMLPNLFPIITALGLMGWLGLPLDMSTMLFVTIAGGLAVDDTVHFMHHYRVARTAGDGVGEAVAETLATAGRAMVVTSLVLGLGFLTCGLASLKNLYVFGVMSSLSIFLAVIADFFICPALMAVLEGGRRSGS